MHEAGHKYIGENTNSIFSKNKPKGFGVLILQHDETKIVLGRHDGWSVDVGNTIEITKFSAL